MKKILMILCVTVISFNNLWATSDLKEEDQDKAKSASSKSISNTPATSKATESWSNFLFNSVVSAKEILCSDPLTEAKKFPHLKVSDLQNLIKKFCPDPSSSYKDLAGKSYAYKTGSIENRTEYYDGLMIILSIDYGDEIFDYRGPQEPYGTPTLKTRKDEITPSCFIEQWLTARKDLPFFKTTPVRYKISSKDNDVNSKCTIEYHARRQNPNEYIILKVYRTPAEN